MSNITEDLCNICDGKIECAPTAILLISLVHTLYGFLNPEPNYFGDKRYLIDGRTRTGADTIDDGFGRHSDRKQKQVVDTAEYDFIVIGGGTAGCVVASRLSENVMWKVLLIEAGTEQPRIALIPGLTSEFKGSTIDWQYSMRPKKGFCQNRGERGCELVQGKVLGGTSTINDMAYMRGSRADYDDWSISGNEGWAYSDVLPFFRYSEGNYDKDILKNKYYHSTKGPLDVGRYPFVDENVDTLLGALNELGYNYTDINGKNQLGFMRIQTMTYFGERVSSYTAFIEPVRHVRNNLDIISEALVTKILFDYKSETLRVNGIEYYKNGTIFKAKASKEVILSAGAINSPIILMKSGVGPREYLNYLDLKLVIDLPVGSNFHDHLSVCLPVINLSKTSTTSNFSEKLKDIIAYYTKGVGPLSANFQVVAFLESSVSEILGTPDIEIRFKGHDSNMYYDQMDLCVSLLTPKSRGQVVLNATDPLFGKPLVYPNFLKDPSDEEKLLEGIRQIVKLFDTEMFKEAGYSFEPLQLLQDNQCDNYERVTEEFWKCIIKHFSSPLHNYVGTCKMGTDKDPESIVDRDLRVYGIQNLRVVDSSVIPKIPRGSIAAPVIMIAEKASSIIKSDWY